MVFFIIGLLAFSGNCRRFVMLEKNNNAAKNISKVSNNEIIDDYEIKDKKDLQAASNLQEVVSMKVTRRKKET
jgi:hypothetical protein